MTPLGIAFLAWIALNVAVFVWLTVADLKSPLCTCGDAVRAKATTPPASEDKP